MSDDQLNLDLDIVLARAKRQADDLAWADGSVGEDHVALVTKDVPALVAEVRRLRADMVRLRALVPPGILAP